ncbi:MAG: ChbG/HpnK family deacetylase [Rhodobacteraceae bacterium]|nr:ChbG/HpnK family deacetylase [Paracoccaceae bacterium]
MIRKVVVHTDDLGMTHGANAAFAELSALGTVTAGSVMVPCPWFAEVAAMAAADPSLDIGVHLTLTSEVPGCRWRPLTRPPASAGLTDDLGFLHPDVPTLRARAHPEAAEAEMRAQIDLALAAGIDVTHVDDHMGAVLAPEFADAYVRVAAEYGLPLVMCPSLSTYGGPHNLAGVTEADFAPAAEAARLSGQTIFDRIVETEWSDCADHAARCRDLFLGLPAGLTYLALHHTMPGGIEAMDRRFHRIRIAEYEVFRSGAFAAWLRDRPGLELVGMRPFRDALAARRADGRRAPPAPA